MHLALIAAQAKNRCIGRDNQMPWHLPEDLRYFKAQTLGKPIIMGRNTYLSLGRPLPGRLNIVLTRDTGFTAEGIRVVHTLEQAIALATSDAKEKGVEELMIIGGAQLYQQALPLADRIYLTELADSFAGDTFFPELDPAQWREIERTDAVSSAPAALAYCHRTLERAK